MSAALDAVRALLAGEPGAGRALLPACRAHAFGAEAFGGDAIAELFARHPAPLSADPHVVETAAGFAVFDASPEGAAQAVVADLYEGRIGRLWRAGPGEGADPCAEPSLALAFDPFLSQARHVPTVEPGDHPELEPAALAALAVVLEARALARGAQRAQALPVRAFGGDGRAAALLAVQSNVGARRRTVACGLEVVVFRHDERGALTHRLVAQDAASPPPTLSRLVDEG